ncbi:MAG: universal stress protein [Dehalobacterium sp.]|jgi:nucleotide-binding universal stress UspA family protein
MLKKILLAIDGSDHGMKAVDYALRLAQIEGGEVEIIYVIANLDKRINVTGHMDPDLGFHLQEKTEEALNEEGKMILDQGKAKFQDTDISCTTKLLTGNPAVVILHEAEKQNADVIVMGSRGLSGITRFVMGSVSSKVVNHAHCSVFIVR